MGPRQDFLSALTTFHPGVNFPTSEPISLFIPAVNPALTLIKTETF
jgi:hypothetical protein